jgi:hypothetical protein
MDDQNNRSTQGEGGREEVRGKETGKRGKRNIGRRGAEKTEEENGIVGERRTRPLPRRNEKKGC